MCYFKLSRLQINRIYSYAANFIYRTKPQICITSSVSPKIVLEYKKIGLALTYKNLTITLRQPKFVSRQREQEPRKRTPLPDVQYVILTLRDGKKLVVSSDSYHGIITVGDMYRCVLCCVEIELESGSKEKHKNSPNHKTMLEKYPHMDEYSVNLVRELSNDSTFCTICNVVIENIQLMRHLQAEVHQQELEKASIRADNYKPHFAPF